MVSIRMKRGILGSISTMLVRSWLVLLHVKVICNTFWLAIGWRPNQYLRNQERQDEPTWRPRGYKIKQRWHPGLKLEVISNAFLMIIDMLKKRPRD